MSDGRRGTEPPTSYDDLRRLKVGEVAPGVVSAAERALASLEQATTLADRMAALEDVTGITGITDCGGAA